MFKVMRGVRGVSHVEGDGKGGEWVRGFIHVQAYGRG